MDALRGLRLRLRGRARRAPAASRNADRAYLRPGARLRSGNLAILPATRGRLPALLRAQPETLPGDRAVRARRPPASALGPDSTCGRTCRATVSGGMASRGEPTDLASIGATTSSPSCSAARLLRGGAPSPTGSRFATSVAAPTCRCTGPPSPARRPAVCGPARGQHAAFAPADAIRAIQITSRSRACMRARSSWPAGPHRDRRPVRPDYGDPVPVGAGRAARVWACGVTPQP
jgi:hypothetical protein